ncbi:hypothetical protein EB796_020384 [Bugula neritina]|uniref:Uncharacterized protein n=1 Tax=Bugula neritina TaxID=10212 RepID=A0A7J7J538_BUGNE|nr:hypothetical protein EB796_020384 [Bugula neritina]
MRHIAYINLAVNQEEMAATFSKNTGKKLALLVKRIEFCLHWQAELLPIKPRQLSCSHCGVDLIDSEIRHCSEGRCICTACLDTSDTECRICNPTASSSDESDSDDYLDDPLDNLASTSREEMEQDGRGIENKKKNYFKPVQVESDKEEQNIPIRPSIFTTIQELMPELDEVVEEMSAKDENAAEVKVFLQLYHQAGDELKNYLVVLSLGSLNDS